jgi:hypothetical protein
MRIVFGGQQHRPSCIAGFLSRPRPFTAFPGRAVTGPSRRRRCLRLCSGADSQRREFGPTLRCKGGVGVLFVRLRQ